MKYNLFVVLLLVLMFSLSTNAQRGRKQSSSSNSALIGNVRKEHISDGCSCNYSFKGKATSTIYSDNLDKEIWMNIDGQDVKLKFVNSVSAPKGEVRKGQRTTSKYVASGITVTINSLVTKAPLKEGEEITAYTQ